MVNPDKLINKICVINKKVKKILIFMKYFFVKLYPYLSSFFSVCKWDIFPTNITKIIKVNRVTELYTIFNAILIARTHNKQKKGKNIKEHATD